MGEINRGKMEWNHENEIQVLSYLLHFPGSFVNGTKQYKYMEWNHEALWMELAVFSKKLWMEWNSENEIQVTLNNVNTWNQQINIFPAKR